MWGGWLHVTGRPGDAPLDPRRLAEDALRTLPPPVSSDLCDALHRYRGRFGVMPRCVALRVGVGGVRPPEAEAPLVALLDAAAERGEAVDYDAVELALAGAREAA
jgi:hypothetical protein